MLNDAKILLTIYVEGGSFTRERSKSYIPYALRANELYKNLFINKKGEYECKLKKEDAEQIVYKGVRWHYALRQNIVQKKTQINEACYNFFISNVPFGGKYDELPIRKKMEFIRQWNDMSDEQRLEWHFSQMASGKDFSYEVID